ncbi:MAG: trypsin-like peptidase domain-containing protein [Anaerolineaceae bacterium]
MFKKIYIPSIFILSVALLVGCSSLTSSESQTTAAATIASEPSLTSSEVQSVDYQTISLTDASVVEAIQETYQDIYTEVNPSVVNIQVTESYGMSLVSGEGSGFVWDEAGHIVTNYHVIENAFNITVVFSDGSTTVAEVVGTDEQSDLAVIQVDPEEVSLHPVKLGDSHSVQVGDLVIAIGNPYGLAGTMTQGIVSALSRSLTVDESDPFSQSNYTIPDIIQTDAAINPGNSGGVLVNVSGEVIGVTSAIQSPTNSNSGIGFAIPAHIIERVVPSLIKTGEYEHPNLGMTGTTMTLSIASEMNLDSDVSGVLITEITRGGAADKAGLIGSAQQYVRPGRYIVTYGDVITAIDDQDLRTYEDLVSYIFNETEVGQEVTLTILRNGEELTVSLVLQGN